MDDKNSSTDPMCRSLLFLVVVYSPLLSSSLILTTTGRGASANRTDPISVSAQSSHRSGVGATAIVRFSVAGRLTISTTGTLALVERKKKQFLEQTQQEKREVLENQIELPMRGLFSVLVERKSQLRIKEESPENLEFVARRERQRRVENESVNDEIKRYREMSEQMAQVGAGANLPAVRQLLTSFYEPLMVGVEREQNMISEGVPGFDRRCNGPYLQLLGADKIAVISLHTIISMLMRGVEKTRGDVFRDHSREHGEAGSVKFVRLASSWPSD